MHTTLLLCLPLACLAVAPSALATAIGGSFDEPSAAGVSVYFANNSSNFRPDADTAEVLADARHAALIYVSGRTSTTRPSRTDEALALRRALAARSYLVSRGVSPLKVMINFASGADFTSDDGAPDDRQEGQRVDIEVIYVPRECCDGTGGAWQHSGTYMPPTAAVPAVHQADERGTRRRPTGRAAASSPLTVVAASTTDIEEAAAPSVPAETVARASANPGSAPAGTPITPATATASNPPPVQPEPAEGPASGAAVPMPVEPPKPEEWIAVTGGTLQSELRRWAEKAGWKVIYDTKTNYHIYADVGFTGRFDEAAASFVRRYERALKPLIVDISLKQRLIYITDRK